MKRKFKTEENKNKKKMKLFKYNQFIGDSSINENLDKAKKFLKDKYLLVTSVKELGLLTGELAAQIKHGERKGFTINDFSDENKELIKKKIRETKLSPEVVKNIERDPELKVVRELKATIITSNGTDKTYQLDRDNIGWLSNFVYFYFYENVPADELSQIYKKLLENKDILTNLEINIDDNLVKKQFDLNFINLDITNNSENLIDGLDRLEQNRKIKKLVDSLTPVLKAAYLRASENNKLKISEIAAGFNQLGIKDGVVDEQAKNKYWSGFFGTMIMREGKMVYSSALARYTTIDEFIKAAQNYLKSTDNDQIIAFYDKINLANDRFGNGGADIVFDQNGILVIEVKSFPTNQLLNGHTSHCIKDSMYQWENYVSSHNNKQYYIYNFNIPQYDNKSTIGVTIEPGQKVRAAHDRADHEITTGIKSLLKALEKEYKITDDIWSFLKPLSQEEITAREKSKIANRKIVEKGLTIEQILKYVKEDGADINKDNCKALENAVEENDVEKAKVILELGGSPNLKKLQDAVISKAKDINMIKLLVDYGAEMTGNVFTSVVNEKEALQYCLSAGLDPSFMSDLPLRACFRGSWVGPNNVGEPYYDSFVLLMKYISKNKGTKTGLEHKGNMIVKWTAEYGRIDILEWYKENGLFDSISKSEIDDLLVWVNISRKRNNEDKEKTANFLRSIKK
jgi:hypothetical protein